MKDYNPTEEELKKELDEIYSQMENDRKEDYEHDMKVLKDNNIPTEALEELMDGCDWNGRLEIVSEPTGDDQDETRGEFFQSIFVDQWSTGMEGDSFAGFIYGKLSENKWLKVPYQC